MKQRFFIYSCASLLVTGLVFVLDFLRFVPIFTDEISYKIMFSRFFLESGLSLNPSLTPQCTNQFTIHIPAIFLPARIFESVVYQDLTEPLKLRIFGIFYFLLIIVLSVVFSHHRLKNNFRWSKCHTLIWVIGFYSLGLLPLFMAQNRPESPILISFLLTMNLYFYKTNTANKMSGGLNTILSIFFFIFYFTFLSYHIKAVLFVPVFIVMALGFSKKKLVILLFWVVIIYGAKSSFDYWGSMLSCPQNKELHAEWEKMGFGVLPTKFNFSNLISARIANIHRSIYYLNYLKFEGSSWLFYHPPEENQKIVSDSLRFLIFRIWNKSFYTLLLVLGVFLVLSFGRALVGIYTDRRVSLDFMISVTIACCLVALLATAYRKANYEVPLIFAMFFILLTQLVAKINNDKYSHLIRGSLYLLFFLALTSQAILLLNYNHLIPEWKRGGIPPGGIFELSGHHYGAVNDQLIGLAQKCKFAPSNNLKHLVLDENSYPAFWMTREPYHANFLFNFCGKIKLSKPFEFLVQKESAGFIGLCRYLPADLWPFAIKERDFCCIPAFNRRTTQSNPK